MKAYLVFTRDKTLNKNELDTYSKEVPTTSPGMTSRFSRYTARMKTSKEPRPRAP